MRGIERRWANHLPLKYFDKTYGDRFGIQFFVENFNSDMLEYSTDLSDGSSPDVNATQYLPTPDLIVEEEQEHWIQFENPSQFDKL